VDIVRDKMNLTERADMVFQLHRKWKPLQVRYEKFGLTNDIEYIEQEMDELEREEFFRIKKVVEKKKEKKLYAMKEMHKGRIIQKRSVNSVMNEKKFLT
jgi:hypothetical protein